MKMTESDLWAAVIAEAVLLLLMGWRWLVQSNRRAQARQLLDCSIRLTEYVPGRLSQLTVDRVRQVLQGQFDRLGYTPEDLQREWHRQKPIGKPPRDTDTIDGAQAAILREARTQGHVLTVGELLKEATSSPTRAAMLGVPSNVPANGVQLTWAALCCEGCIAYQQCGFDRACTALRTLTLLNQLSEPEGASVHVYYPNPDWGAPEDQQQKIAICDDWTHYKPLEFFGATLQDALEAALAAKKEHTDAHD
jgi:hypothetical protein